MQRPSHPWTSTVHAVLEHLRAVGVRVVPVPLAITADHEEVSLLEGESGAACWPHQAKEPGLRSAPRMLCTVHDATVGWVPSPDATWAVAPVEPSEVICHGDPGPGTWCGSRVGSLACSTGTCAIRHRGRRTLRTLWSTSHRFVMTPRQCAGTLRIATESARSNPSLLRRVRHLADGVVDAVIDVQRRDISRVRMLAAAGIHPQVDWVGDGYLDELAARLARTQSHRHLFD